MTNANEPAFPNEGTHQFAYNGLTKREYFAAMAMQGLLSNPNWNLDEKYAATEAIGQADALLRQLES